MLGGAVGLVTVHGASWCKDTRRSLRLLRRLGVSHRFRDVDDDAAALRRVFELNDGKRQTPVIELSGEVLVEPGNTSLTSALLRNQLITAEQVDQRRSVQNLGDLERGLRVAVGGLTCLAARETRGVSRGLLTLGGLATLLTGLAGWCPTYAAAGVSSLEGPGDRPAESERTDWLTRIVHD